jgi:hypothetical protein
MSKVQYYLQAIHDYQGNINSRIYKARNFSEGLKLQTF